MENLDTLAIKITKMAENIDKLLQMVCAPKNTLISKDPHWGKHTVFLTIRLDEFNPHTLGDMIPELKNLLNQYLELRSQERKIIEQIHMEKANENSNTPLTK